MALLLFLISVCMNYVIEFSFSSFYMKNIAMMQVLLYGVNTVVNIVFGQFLQEALLLVPINALFRICSNLTTLAAPSLLEFILAFFVTLALQITDRIYVSSNLDYFYEQGVRGLRRLKKAHKWLTTGAKDQQVDTVLDVLDVALSSDEEDQDAASKKKKTSKTVSAKEANAAPEDMIAFLTGFSTDVISAPLVPIFIVFVWLVYDECLVLDRYDIRKSRTWEYINFYAVVVFFQHVVDVVAMNTLELYHGWRLTDYFEFCNYRFLSRPNRWKGLGETVDETVAPTLRSMDLACFSEQFYFMNFLCREGR